jgi:hypothetical protein
VSTSSPPCFSAFEQGRRAERRQAEQEAESSARRHGHAEEQRGEDRHETAALPPQREDSAPMITGSEP